MTEADKVQLGARESERTYESGVASSVERGAVLIIALFVVILISLLGLAFLLSGETESRIARNQRESTSALYAAEGGMRIVKKWFDAPTGANAYLVPTVGQMDRTLRYVDDNNDGTYGAYSSATPPYNVTYKQSTNDPFQKPYRGTPEALFLGIETQPDIRISAAGSSGERSFLTALNDSLYPDFPTPGERVRITKIDVYSPPILTIGGQRTRYGIATVKITAGIFQYAGTADESQIATRTVKAVINEVPYQGGPLGPLDSCQGIDLNGNFTPHWGRVTAVTQINLQNNLDSKVPSSVPWWNWQHIIEPDENGDGALISPSWPDNQDGDATLDFDWWLTQSGGIEDPWLCYWSQGDILSNSQPIDRLHGNYPGCSGDNCQPAPFYNPPPGGGLSPVTADHSNLFKNITKNLCPDFEYDFWKSVALSGGDNIYYYRSDGVGLDTYKLFGMGPSVDFRTALDGRSGFFFFDSGTNSAPVDADFDGTYDNLAGEAHLSGGGLTTGGFIYLNANFRTDGNGSASPSRQLIAPGEPYIDANSDGTYENGELFLDINYPTPGPNDTAQKNGMHFAGDGSGIVRQVPALDATAAGKYSAQINFYGVLFINGAYDAQGNWLYFGSVIAKNGVVNSSGNPDIYFDDRLNTGGFPPTDLDLPRTYISSWQTEM